MLQRCLVILVLLLAVSAVIAREKITPQSLMAKSDAHYYLPTAHGLQDLAVDVIVDQWANASDPVAKAAKISYYYAGVDQRFAVSDMPASYDKFRDNLLANLMPVSQYIIPRSMSDTFTGMTLKCEKVSRQLAGVSTTSFYQLSGTPKDEQDTVKEYRVLLDDAGAILQVENVMKDKTLMAASVDNVKTEMGWHLAAITTRLADANGVYYKTERVEYQAVDGFMLPTTVTTQFRDHYNKPIRTMPDFKVTLQNYRLNTGEAAKMLAE